MPKHKNSRDEEHQSSQSSHEPITIQYSLSSLSDQPKQTVQVKHTSNHYTYVLHDLRKTAILSGILILLQCFLLFSLHQHLVRIPSISY